MSSTDKIRRLLHVLERLQSGRIHNAEELASFCGVSRRTMFRDLKCLQDSGIQVLYDTQRQGYWIPLHAYLPPAELTLSETLSLLILAQEHGDASRGIPFQESARDAVLKLQSNLPAHLSAYVSEFVSAVRIDVEPHSALNNGREHYERITEAVVQKRKVRIQYHSLAEQKRIQTLVSPYRLLFRRHSWYVIGRSSLHRAVRTFHLGRIESSELTEETFRAPPRFSLKRYFGNAWNMIREENASQEVTVRFEPKVAQNVAEVAWHATQQVVWNNDGSMIYTVTVDGINEISWWILSYGDQATVLSPPALRQLIQDRAQCMVSRYAEQEPASPPAGKAKRARKSARRSTTAEKSADGDRRTES